MNDAASDRRTPSRALTTACLTLALAFAAHAQPQPQRPAISTPSDGGAAQPGAIADRIDVRAEQLRDEGLGQEWVRSLVERSRKRFDNGEYVEAAAAARLAWDVARRRVESGERDRMPMEAAYNEAVALLALELYDEAEGRLRAVRAMSAEDDFERRMVADAAYNLGLIRLATADTQRAASEGSRDPLFGLLLGDPEDGWRAYDEAADRNVAAYRAAADLFAEVLAANPADVDAARNNQIATLRAGEIQRSRYEAWRERQRIADQIVRPDEAIETLRDLAARQGEAEQRTARAIDADASDPTLEATQRPVTDDTEALFERVARTLELLGGPLGETVPPPSLDVLRTLYEEAELGLWDTVDGQRWAAFELDEPDLPEARGLQAQAERDLLAILEKLRTRTPPPPPPQGGGQDDQQQPQQQQDDQRSPEDREPPEEDTGETDFREERLAREREALLRQIFEREELDLERVRDIRPQRRDRPPEKDY